jgi:16S rRNA (adenine1518-N6/adenine1519-N6)-dimethyltransferase
MLKKKSLGQNFLTSKTIAKSIALAGKPNPDETIIEIGPGEGFLTEELLKICNKIVVIEKDHRLIPILNEKFKNDISKGKLTVIEEDILDFDIEKNGIDIKYRIIANIPYYITGQIIRKFLEANKKPISMTLLLQKEVAERILARDGKESLLSLSVKIFGKPSIVRTVGRGAFNPVPNVDSAVLNIEEISNKKLDGVDQDDFFKVIHAGFAHKRKQLLPNLSNLFNKDMVSQALIDLKINPKIRAEDVKLDDWIKITKKII